MKRIVRAKYYIRYADDFVIIDNDKKNLLEIKKHIVTFLRDELILELHPQKVSISTAASGVDFLGWVHFPHHRTLRTVTKRRVMRGVRGHYSDSPVVQSYLSLLSHGDTHNLQKKLEKDNFL